MIVAEGALEIRISELGVRLYRLGTEEMEWHIGWDEITKIAVWKDDVFAYDIISMGFAWAGTDGYKGVDEEMKGWDALVQEIERRFGVAQSSWWSNVAFPAFATNHQVIWRKATV